MRADASETHDMLNLRDRGRQAPVPGAVEVVTPKLHIGDVPPSATSPTLWCLEGLWVSPRTLRLSWGSTYGHVSDAPYVDECLTLIRLLQLYL